MDAGVGRFMHSNYRNQTGGRDLFHSSVSVSGSWWRGADGRTRLGRRRSLIRGHQSRQVDEPVNRRRGDADLVYGSGHDAATGRGGARAEYVLPKRTSAIRPNGITLQAHPESTRGCFGSIYPMRRDRYSDEQADQVGRWLAKFFQDRINRADT